MPLSISLGAWFIFCASFNFSRVRFADKINSIAPLNKDPAS